MDSFEVTIIDAGADINVAYQYKIMQHTRRSGTCNEVVTVTICR